MPLLPLQLASRHEEGVVAVLGELGVVDRVWREVTCVRGQSKRSVDLLDVRRYPPPGL